MKIYYIANARMPTEKAHGIQIAKMCEALAEQGAALELIVPNRKTARKSIQEFYGLRVPIRCVKLPIVDLYGAGRVGFFISSCIYALGYFFYLLREKINGKSGIIYTIDIDQFSFFLVSFLGMPYAAEIHDAKEPTLPFRILFRSARGIIVINSIIKEKLCARFGISPQKIIVCPNGADLRQFRRAPDRHDARGELDISENLCMALYVGKFYDWKSVGILADAARILKDAITIYAVGGSREEFLKASKQNVLPANLIFVPSRPHAEIPLWLAACDAAIVLGTRANEYSFSHTSPMKLFDYMASRRPIVASDTPANRQIVSEDEAFFYEPDSAESLASAIRTALSDVGGAEKRTEAAYRKAEVFSWENRAKNILAFILRG